MVDIIQLGLVTGNLIFVFEVASRFINTRGYWAGVSSIIALELVLIIAVKLLGI